MPYASEKQRRFMYSQHPEIAKRWDKEGKNYIKKKRKGGSCDEKAVKLAQSMKK